MQIHTTIASLRQAIASGSGTLGLVPTMGALHEGHLSLVRAARSQCGRVVASLFVNPTQFGPNEDFSRYPRTFERDCQLFEQAGVDLLFAPQPEEMYPHGPADPNRTFVEVPGISERLDGHFRPGHLRAVASVVAKLFHIVSPDFAYFGQKDAAQVATIRAMVRDLNFPLHVMVCPTVRDPDGLALSSRNRYLTTEQRTQALALSRALALISTAVSEGIHEVPTLVANLTSAIRSSPGLRFEYAEIVDPDTLEPIANLKRGALVAVAAYLGNTRLIDNMVLPPMQPIAVQTTAQEVSA
ncbi:pantoate--beta-alanine ligase [Granulicella sp. WH15]|uniref:pantoate--beta-alanine ligase n=1 Tax=Granulicella sp. WH15 TaxID=2602070 RepID=UPI001366E583|nr:pantoate--beta-alanine ligase [Granulicella sp. WH15]QHN02546.1 pantoate--beta-alanine ligase [Granulicella sp. WH15]